MLRILDGRHQILLGAAMHMQLVSQQVSLLQHSKQHTASANIHVQQGIEQQDTQPCLALLTTCSSLDW